MQRKYNRRKRFLTIFLVSVIFNTQWPAIVFAATLTDSSAANFNAGTHSDTEYDEGNSWLELDSTGVTNGTGIFTSRIYNAGTVATEWQTLTWTPNRPTGKALPNSDGVESAYNTGNIDMSSNSLLAHFDQVEYTGTADEVVDSSGNGIHGVAVDNAAITKVGDAIVDRAVALDGDGDVIDFGDSLDNVFSGNDAQFSVAFWIKRANVGENDYVVGKYANSGCSAGSQRAWLLEINSSNLLIFTWSDPSYSNARGYRADTTALSSIAQWYHVAAVYDGSQDGGDGANRITLYVNGIAQSETQTVAEGSIPDMSDVTAHLGLGSTIKSGGTVCHDSNETGGKFDEFAIWDKLLTGTQVLDMYERGALRTSFQVRSCDDASCSGETFLGPDQTANTFYTEDTSPTTSTPSVSVYGAPTNDYIQYKLIMETDSTAYSPEMVNVTLTTAPLPAPFFNTITMMVSASVAGYMVYVVAKDMEYEYV